MHSKRPGMATPTSAGTVVPENSRSVAGLPLPPCDEAFADESLYGTILLFYQYKEPAWTKQEHRTVLKQVLAMGSSLSIAGRGRVAPEGLNCTLSGTPAQIRLFCQALREHDPLFLQTDFKLTDGVTKDKLFKSLSIRKTTELVAYGLSGDKAPSLTRFAGTHLEAKDYHDAMLDPETVVIDVRNAYETNIGRFQPPKGGATLLDPKMRNSIEFPKWLHDPSTQQQLTGKKVLMYCTGGIRCERATALLNQMSTLTPSLQPKGVYHMQGGIERYLKTFPDGGLWQGANYLFDRRMEQLPGNQNTPSADITATCVVCRRPHAHYRGKFKCAQGLCGVPVIVCDDCKLTAAEKPKQLTCDLCREGHKAPQLMPDLAGMKRKAERRADSSSMSSKRVPGEAAMTTCDDRLFLSRLPLTTTRTKLSEALGAVRVVHWLTDQHTGAFYGSAICQMESADDAQRASKKVVVIDKKKVRLTYCQRKETDVWPPLDFKEREYPPVGH
jgi:predicted sulfurtransferase